MSELKIPLGNLFFLDLCKIQPHFRLRVNRKYKKKMYGKYIILPLDRELLIVIYG